MRPLQHFRLWLRRGPASERVVLAVATLAVLALVSWLLSSIDAPTSRIATTVAGARTRTAGPHGGSTAAGSTEATQTGSTGPAVAEESGIASGSVAPGSRSSLTQPNVARAPTLATSGRRGCAAAPASGPGVSGSQINIVVMLIDIVGPAANDVFAIPRTDQQQRFFNAVFDSVNDEGGIACRKVVPQYMNVNPADQSDQQRKCLDAVAARPFAVIDPGAYSFTSPICFAQRHVPYFGGFFLTTKEAQQGYPYLFNLANYDHLYRDTILGLRDRSAFEPAKGFKK